MIINCGICGRQIEISAELEEGQHVSCPFCNGKFSYRSQMQNLSRMAHQNADSSSASRTNRGSTVRTAIIVTLLIGVAVFGFVKFKAHKEQQALDERRQREEERARAEKAAQERKAEEERIRKEKEEREAARRREIEERAARAEKERLERLQREKEAEEERRKAAAAEAARESYRRASDAFGGGATAFYSEVSDEKRASAASEVLWYVDESFARDKRIYEVKNGSTVILYPDKIVQTSDTASPIASIDTKPGLMANGRDVWICGKRQGVKSSALPEKGKEIVPFDCELDGLLEVALALGVNPPVNHYNVALKVKGSGKSIAVGTFGATEPVSRGRLEKAVRDELNRRTSNARHSASASAVEDYIAVCELVLRRTGSEEKEAIKETSNRRKEPKSCYKCHGKGVVKVRVRETCDECGGAGVIEKEVTLKDTKHTTDGYWNYRHVGTKKSVNRQTCQKCRRSGKVSVEKEVECSVCHGSGTR